MTRSISRDSRAWWALVSVVWLVFVLRSGRDTGYYFDDWNFVLDRRSGGLSDFTTRHIDHIVVLPVAVYKLSWAIFGDGAVWPLRVVAALFYLGCGTLIFDLVKRRCDARLAVVAGILFLMAGKGWQGMLLPFQLQSAAAVFFGLLAVAALDRQRRFSAPVAAVALLLCALSSGLCIFFFAAIAVELALKRDFRRLVVLAPAVIVFGAWYLAEGGSSFTRPGLWHAPDWAVNAASFAASGVLSLPTEWGPVLLVLLTGAILASLWRCPASPRLIAMLVLGVGFWVATGAARSFGPVVESPEAGRYLLMGLAAYLLVVAEILRDVEIPDRVIHAIAVIAVIAVALGAPQIHQAGNDLRRDSASLNAALLATKLIGPRTPANYEPDPRLAPQIWADRFFRQATDVPSGTIAGSPEEARFNADRVLSEIAIAPANGVRAGRCERVSGVRTFTVNSGAVLAAKGSGSMTARRFADTAHPLAAITPRERGYRFARDSDPTPYSVAVSSVDGAVVCV